ncbi:hypothetical protein SeH_A3695 [Salmonella enterica subsp. enterica serovar Hadar str. RI_05P066]|nr:hypothetical protein SeH_A3695 [Salmonella enterica subsp. enterica serovar Hadar str. RI_05P066]
MIPLLQFMDNMRCDNHLHFVPGINLMYLFDRAVRGAL